MFVLICDSDTDNDSVRNLEEIMITCFPKIDFWTD